MSISLTKRQAECLAFLRRYLAENDGSAPTFEQIRVALDLSGKSSVHRLLESLEARGHIRRLPYRQQAIELLDRPRHPVEPGSLTDHALKALAEAMAVEIKRRGL